MFTNTLWPLLETPDVAQISGTHLNYSIRLMIVASNICQALNMIFTGTFLLYGSYAYTVSVSMSSFRYTACFNS